jgi:hypothetical protein
MSQSQNLKEAVCKLYKLQQRRKEVLEPIDSEIKKLNSEVNGIRFRCKHEIIELFPAGTGLDGLAQIRYYMCHKCFLSSTTNPRH